jgi:hydroxymethylglutaryl-CoA lyase
MNNYPKVLITDETLRDGLQIEREGVTIEEKLEILEMMVKAGLKRIVVGAFVNPKWSPQMADSLELVKRLKVTSGVSYFVLALNERGRLERLEYTPPLATETIHATHLHVCPIFIQRNTNRTLEEQEHQWQAPIQRSISEGMKEGAIGLSAGWGSNFSGEFSHEQRMTLLQKQYQAWQKEGIQVTRLDMADPMAWNTPSAMAQDLNAIKNLFPSITQFRLHLHNARGLAMVSMYEAIKSLDNRHTIIADTSIGGIGGCPYCGNGQATGMIPTEDFVHLLDTLGIETGISVDALIAASARLSEILGRPLHSQVALNGPLPKGDKIYNEDVPAVFTFYEAQHFRLGPKVYEGNPKPWLKKLQTQHLNK